MNRFPTLKATKDQIEQEIGELPEVQRQLDEIKQQLGGRNFDLIERYEDNERRIRELEQKVKEIEASIKELEKQLAGIDVHISKQPDPVYDLVQKLPSYFTHAAEALLKMKKEGIEATMKEQLNRNLLVYQGQIDRVVFSEELRDLQFQLFHKAGNEIALSQLNTASKQIVVQCLLKALHDHGDYNPPVMIDTVMGVLDEDSRNTILEFFFPKLAHQTILFSTDSEIRLSDLPKIQSFISQTYTLKRDIAQQRTDVTKGYFDMNEVSL
jgi:DNA sulfur modification protein DndD